MILIRSTGNFRWPGITAFLCAVAISFGAVNATDATGTFASMKGTYAGLFYDTNQTAHASSGFLKVDVTRRGAFSGSIVSAGKKYSFSGRFPPSAAVSKIVARRNVGPVRVSMQLNLNGGNDLTGLVSNGTWTSTLAADRATYQANSNPAPQTGRYTLLIPGGEDSSVQPGGDGFGALIVDRSGQVMFSGILGDGTKVSQKAFVSSRGRWPLYASLNSAAGSILGWLTFSNKLNCDLDGMVSWIELPQPSATFYPAGFTNETKAFGLAYHFTNGVSVVNSATGRFWAAGGNLPESFTNQILLGSDNTVSNLSDNSMRLKLTPQSGFFEGRVVDPVTGRTNFFQGIVLQSKRLGAGSSRSHAPAGWNTWYSHGSDISDDVIKFEMRGLDYLRVLDMYPDFGIWIDDGWQASREPRTDLMQPLMWDTNKFPNGLSNTVALIHSHGYKAYLYTEPNPWTSAGFTGSSMFFESDARLFASWGFDGVKFDQPNVRGDAWRMDNLRRMMAAFREAAPDRDVLFWSSGWWATNAQQIASAPTGSIIRYGNGFSDWWNEGYPADDWYGIYVNFLKRVDSYITFDLLRSNGPGHWLFTEAAVNNCPLGRPIVSMWAMWAAPMIFSDFISGPEEIFNAMNPELYDIDRDPLWLAALPIQTNATHMVWLKPLADDSVAVALLNRTRDIPQTIGFTWEEIGWKNSRLATVRDIWDQLDLTVTSGSYTSSVPGQTVQVLRIFPQATNLDRFSCFGSGLVRGTNQTGRVCIEP